MFSPLLIGTLLSFLLIGIDAKGGGSQEFDSQCQNSNQLVTPQTPSQPTSAPIVTGLQTCSSNTLDSSDQTTFSVLIQLVGGIVSNTNITVTQQVSQVALQISLFLQINVQISNYIQFCSINGPSGSPFGSLQDVVQVGMQIDSMGVDSQVQLSPSGSCPLFTALQSACSQTGNFAVTSSVTQLISTLTQTLQLGGYTVDQQLALISIDINAFLSANPSLQSFILNIQLGSFGTVGNLVGVCGEFHLIATVANQLTGTTPSNCPLLAALSAAAQNYTSNANIATAINNLLGAIQANFSGTTDVNARLSFVSQQVFSLLSLQPWLTTVIFSIEIPGFGNIYELCSCSHFCQNINACPLITQGLQPASSTTPSTIATTTPTPTINCTQSSLNSLVAYQPGSKYCILLESIIEGVGNWTKKDQLKFASTLKKVKKDLKISKKKAKKDTPKKQAKRSKKAVKHLNKFSKNKLSERQLMFNIPIISNGTTLGILGEFCLCVKPNFKVQSSTPSSAEKGKGKGKGKG